ncbi:PAN domain-containing protein [Erythrobacter sp. F6033]|uniref:PAN domain-containing protein n=1 Tax=Erythrobacter sp. F6033 TaxID=2926401 RepID=UPI001FF58835|nr:PAN domain-containing protein [Erythrobacter sp. F6033]MCK0129268.1 PAN domain-containing protein [Erythrobacter sp. F6033]
MRKLVLICLSLIGLGLGGAVVAQTIGSVSNGYIEEGDLYRPGNLIKTITMSNRGQDETTCRKACDGDGNCKAYSYVQESSNRKPLCYLRLAAIPVQARRNHGYAKVVSGTKLSFLRDDLGINSYPGRTIDGAVEKGSFKIANEDPMACVDACWRDGTCSSYTFKPATRFPKSAPAQCTLHTKGGSLSLKTVPGILSGSKSRMSVPRASRLPDRSNTTPKPRATFEPRPKPVIERPKGQTITIPDQNSNDGALSDDDDAKFPGEMLSPDDQGVEKGDDDEQFPGEMLQPE